MPGLDPAAAGGGAPSGDFLVGRTAFVTGAAGGIGWATARRLAQLGATVVGADIADEAGEARFAELGATHRYVHLDVTDHDEWRRVTAEVGRIDVAHLNAGVMTRPAEVSMLDDPLDWLSSDAYRRVMGVNVDGVVYGLMATIPHLASDGAHVLITASTAGVQPFEPDPVYGASKAALILFARSIEPWLAKRGIRLDVICPHGILTDIVPVDLRERPDKTFSSPEYIADSVVRILGSDERGRVWIARSESEPAWPLRYEDVLPREAYIAETVS
jgi:NAD(P)-dependent dehydrogenase (short-subunit alcohol dehydrogenase family)